MHPFARYRLQTSLRLVIPAYFMFHILKQYTKDIQFKKIMFKYIFYYT